MPQSRIKGDAFSAGYFVEVVINTVGEAVKEAEREGEADKAGETEGERQKWKLLRHLEQLLVLFQERSHYHKNMRL